MKQWVRYWFYAIKDGLWACGFDWKDRKFGYFKQYYDGYHYAWWLGPFYVCVSY